MFAFSKIRLSRENSRVDGVGKAGGFNVGDLSSLETLASF
jgi:hypothetical protein